MSLNSHPDRRATLRLSNQLSLQASGGYLKAVYDAYKGAGGNGVNADGNPLTNAPKWSLSGGATYDQPIGKLGSVQVSANAQYQSSFFSNALARPQDRVPGQAFVNGSLTWTTADPRIKIAIQGKNILGADKPVSSQYIPSTGVYYKNYADPATVLVSISFSQ